MSTMQPAEKEYILSAMPGFDDLLLKVLWETMTKNGGLQKMDPDVLKAFYDEFKKRPGLLESMTESRKRNKMKLTKRQLKRIIKEEYSKLIKESSLPAMDYSMMRRLFDWINTNEEMGDSLDFLGTVDTFFESEADAGEPLDGMEEEVHQSLNDLIDLKIVQEDERGNLQQGQLISVLQGMGLI